MVGKMSTPQYGKYVNMKITHTHTHTPTHTLHLN